jgi:hypothetical protein
MSNQKAFLLTAIILMSSSTADANLILTLNGTDITDLPRITQGGGDLVVAIAGSTPFGPNDLSIVAFGGFLEADPNANNTYYFEFDSQAGEASVRLVTNINMVINGNEVPANTTIYELWLFYNRQSNIFAACGIGLEYFLPLEQGANEQGKYYAENIDEPIALNVAGEISETGSQPEQQNSVSQTAEPPKSYSEGMSGGGTNEIDSFPEPNSYPDFNSDKIVNLVDFARFAGNWQKSGSGLDGDFDNDGTVDNDDLATFAYFWLNGPHPLDVFESFKTALSASDVNEALTYIAEISREKYAEIFQIIEPHLSDYAAGMGELIFDRQRFGEVKYEMLHQDGPQTLSFPVFFIRDEDGNWRLFNF